MKAAVTCIYEGNEISIDEAVSLREVSSTPLFFTCIVCSEPLRAHRLGKNNHPAHFEHLERNYNCPHSEGDGVETFYGINDKRAIEGYEQDKKILSGARNQSLAKECKVRDDFKCKACGFKLKHNGKYIIECHHTNPIGIGGARETMLDDLISLCPTCHRIAHTRKEPLTVEEIKYVLKNH